MGVRIAFYALDLEQVDEIAQMTLKDLLWFYSEQSCSHWLWIESPDTRIYAKPDGVYLYKGKQAGELTREWVDETSFLSQTVRDYVANDGTYWLKELFDCLALCDTVGWIRRISDGHRRWWMGSLLNAVGDIHGKSGDVYQKLVALFQNVLSGYDCGTELPVGVTNAKPSLSFPMPTNDPDLRTGFWTGEDVRIFLDIVHTIPSNTVFKPALSYGIAPDSVNGWNKWVWGVLEGLLTLQTLDYKDLGVVTFIG